MNGDNPVNTEGGVRNVRAFSQSVSFGAGWSVLRIKNTALGISVIVMLTGDLADSVGVGGGSCGARRTVTGTLVVTVLKLVAKSPVVELVPFGVKVNANKLPL